MKKQILLAVPFIFGAVSADNDNGSSQKDKYCGVEVSAGVSCQYSNSDVWGAMVSNAQLAAWPYNYCFGHMRGTRFGGVVGTGYNAFFGNLRAGLGLGVDLTGSKSSTKDLTDVLGSDLGMWKLKTRGVVPTVYASLGYYLCAIDALAGIKGGLTYVYSELSSDGSIDTIKNKGVTPVVGFFFEKNVYGKFNVRAEFDYRLGVSKHVRDHAVRLRQGGQFVNNAGINGDLRMKYCGYAVRVVGVYNF